MKRSHEALRARDLGRGPRAVGSTTPPEADYPRMLRALGARLEPPSPTRPYWAVYQGRRFLAAARGPRDAIARAYLDAAPRRA